MVIVLDALERPIHLVESLHIVSFVDKYMLSISVRIIKFYVVHYLIDRWISLTAKSRKMVIHAYIIFYTTRFLWFMIASFSRVFLGFIIRPLLQ
jgi:hypothetical protein